MSPLLLLIAALLLFHAAGLAGVESFATLRDSMRYALAVTFTLSGAGHFTKMKSDLARMVPPWLPKPKLLVGIVGTLQLLGGVGLLFMELRRAAAYLLIALLILKLPVNVWAASARLGIEHRLATPPALRVPLQILWIGLLLWSAHAA